MFRFLKLKAKLSIFVNYLITFKVLTTKPSDTLFFSEFCSGFRNDILENLHKAIFLCLWGLELIFDVTEVKISFLIVDIVHFIDFMKYQHSSLGGL